MSCCLAIHRMVHRPTDQRNNTGELQRKLLKQLTCVRLLKKKRRPPTCALVNFVSSPFDDAIDDDYHRLLSFYFSDFYNVGNGRICVNAFHSSLLVQLYCVPWHLCHSVSIGKLTMKNLSLDFYLFYKN